MTPVELEKKNLEMHVELGALRDQAIKDDIHDLKAKIEALEKMVADLKEVVEEMKDDRNSQLIKWGSAIILTLISALGMIFLRVFIPMLMNKPPAQ